MKILQIGTENWCSPTHSSTEWEWVWISKQQLALDITPYMIQWDGLLLTDAISAPLLERVTRFLSPYSLFLSPGVVLDTAALTVARKKGVRMLPRFSSRQKSVLYLVDTLYPGQWEEYLYAAEGEVVCGFSGAHRRLGKAALELEMTGSLELQPLLSIPHLLKMERPYHEIWLEYEKDPGVAIQLVLTPVWEKGDRLGTPLYLSETDMVRPYRLEREDGLVGYLVSIWGGGSGFFRLYGLAHRWSRLDGGTYLPGARRLVDASRNEWMTYFYPGSLQGPLRVHFLDGTNLQGFGDWRNQVVLEQPTLLVLSPRGSFLSPDNSWLVEIEKIVLEICQSMQLQGQDLLLSGFSLGTYPALLFASHMPPHALLLGRPLTNSRQWLKALPWIEESVGQHLGDDLLRVDPKSTSLIETAKQLDHNFWNQLKNMAGAQTFCILGLFEEEELDPLAGERLLVALSGYLPRVKSQLFAGRWMDQSSLMVSWLKEEVGKYWKAFSAEKGNRE